MHCYFEIGLIGAIKQIWPNSELKLCLWQLYRNIETNRNKIFGDVINHNEEPLNIIKSIKTLVYIEKDYVKDVFNLKSEDAEHIGEKEKQFVNSYFKKFI